MRAGKWTCVVVLLAACAAEPPIGERTDELATGRTLVRIGEATVALPSGSDAQERFEVGWRAGDGTVEPIAGGPWLAAVAAFDQAALVDTTRALLLIGTGNGAPRVLGRDVFGTPVASGDGARLVWVEAHGDEGVVRLLDAQGTRTIASGLASAGALRFADDGAHVRLVGARNGGVAGIWEAPLDGSGARCVTNCDLRTGEPWGDRYVPPPREAP